MYMKIKTIVIPDKGKYKLPEDVEIDSENLSNMPQEARILYIVCELLKLEKVQGEQDEYSI